MASGSSEDIGEKRFLHALQNDVGSVAAWWWNSASRNLATLFDVRQFHRLRVYRACVQYCDDVLMGSSVIAVSQIYCWVYSTVSVKDFGEGERRSLTADIGLIIVLLIYITHSCAIKQLCLFLIRHCIVLKERSYVLLKWPWHSGWLLGYACCLCKISSSTEKVSLFNCRLLYFRIFYGKSGLRKSYEETSQRKSSNDVAI